MDIEEYRKMQFIVAHDAFLSTCHFVKIENKTPKSHGSGVFIEVDGVKFLVTAAHVVEGFENDIHVRIGKHRLLSLGGEFTVNATNDRTADKIDIAILKLNEDTIKSLGDEYVFLQQDNLGINHSYLENPLYTSVGFPASKSKANRYRRDFASKAFVFLTKPAESIVYDELDCRLHVNIVVNYDKNRVVNHSTGEIVTGPDVYGISGSGLWYIPEQTLSEETAADIKLVAIMTEWPVKNRKYWIGTSIDVVTELIRAKYCLKLTPSEKIQL